MGSQHKILFAQKSARYVVTPFRHNLRYKYLPFFEMAILGEFGWVVGKLLCSLLFAGSPKLCDFLQKRGRKVSECLIFQIILVKFYDPSRISAYEVCAANRSVKDRLHLWKLCNDCFVTCLIKEKSAIIRWGASPLQRFKSGDVSAASADKDIACWRKVGIDVFRLGGKRSAFLVR